ncbi:urease accessory protein UreE [Halopenitus sp. H-Gu1]|uniref:urease accessory protein UreE n=1 Tax=Halopenitus sp. H-Gu1 TaxID=3242697 RepID=UPI00359EF77A
MLVANTYLGHLEDPEIESRLENTEPARVVLSDVERRRSRVRTETVDGRDLGIVVSRELGDGDVLETDSGVLIVIGLAAVDALVLEFGDAEVSATTALEIGHALGNRHLDLAVRDEEALFPVPDTRNRLQEAIDGLLPDGVTTRFEAVPPTTFDEGGGHDGNDHEHDEDDHSPDHEHDDRGIGGRSAEGSRNHDRNDGGSR